MILSVPFCPYHFVPYHFVLEPLFHPAFEDWNHSDTWLNLLKRQIYCCNAWNFGKSTAGRLEALAGRIQPAGRTLETPVLDALLAWLSNWPKQSDMKQYIYAMEDYSRWMVQRMRLIVLWVQLSVFFVATEWHVPVVGRTPRIPRTSLNVSRKHSYPQGRFIFLMECYGWTIT